MVVLWDPMSPIYIKTSKFPNVLLVFKFSKLLNNQEKLTGGENTLLATPSKGCQLGEDIQNFVRRNICL